MLGDYADEGDLINNLTRPQNVGMVQLDTDSSSPLFAGDELVDLRSNDAMLNAGDLVELKCVPCFFLSYLCCANTMVIAPRVQGDPFSLFV